MSHKCLWERTRPDSGKIHTEHLCGINETQWFDDYEKRQKIYRFVLDQNNREDVPCPDDLFPPEFSLAGIERGKEFAEYFERLVQTRITRIIADRPLSHLVDQVWANVRVHPFAGGNEIAEYDLVLVTNFGTIISCA